MAGIVEFTLYFKPNSFLLCMPRQRRGLLTKLCLEGESNTCFGHDLVRMTINLMHYFMSFHCENTLMPRFSPREEKKILSFDGSLVLLNGMVTKKVLMVCA